MKIDPNECRDPALLAAEVRRLQRVIDADNPSYPHPPLTEAWISVKERLPKLHFSVICFLNGHASEMQCTRHHDRLRWYYPASGEYDDGVTHWMPLPAPPTDAK